MPNTIDIREEKRKNIIVCIGIKGASHSDHVIYHHISFYFHMFDLKLYGDLELNYIEDGNFYKGWVINSLKPFDEKNKKKKYIQLNIWSIDL